MAPQKFQHNGRETGKKLSCGVCPERCPDIARVAPGNCKRSSCMCKTLNNSFLFPRHLSSPHGFTLIEILVAILILGMVMSTVYAAYSGTMKLAQEMTYENGVYNAARTAMDRIVRDLSSVQPVGGAFEIRSDKESWKNHEFGSLYFWAASHLAFNEKEIDGSTALIGYFAGEDATGGTFSLYRSDLPGNKAIKGKNKTGGFMICPGIESLIFKFYDINGKEYDFWDSSSSGAEQKGKVPVIIKIELVLANAGDKEKPFKFMTKVFLPAKL